MKYGCLHKAGHAGKCSTSPTEAWDFLSDKDKDKLGKAGYATPRGGSKGAYQNHVYRNNKVIIPYEKVNSINLKLFKDGYVIRVFPEQCFEAKKKLRAEFVKGIPAKIGENAFVLYRSHENLETYPPLTEWQVRYLEDKNGNKIETRKSGAIDKGHYVLRLSKIGGGKKITKGELIEGPPQGIFAPEYADADTDYLCRVVLAWQIIHTVDSPYTTSQATHLQMILQHISMLDYSFYQQRGIMIKTFTTCPLCQRPIYYNELHDMLRLEEESGLINAADQVQGVTRSTIINLFHFHPLVYEQLEHIPPNVAWGHATCNTKLGQRRCYSLCELIAMSNKVGVMKGEKFTSFGWASEDMEMIRSPQGAVWIQITRDRDYSKYPFLHDKS